MNTKAQSAVLVILGFIILVGLIVSGTFIALKYL